MHYTYIRILYIEIYLSSQGPPKRELAQHAARKMFQYLERSLAFLVVLAQF